MTPAITSGNELAALEATLAQVQSLARQYAREIRGHFGKRARQVRLYGSAARGDWTTESDIDVLVLLDQIRPEDADWLVRRALTLSLENNGLFLQPLFMSETDFANMAARELLFAIEVQREGSDL